MIVSVDNVTITLDPTEVARFAAIIGDDRPAVITKAAARALRHVLRICAADGPREPLLLDHHVFVATKMLEDEGAPIDRASIELVLGAWRAAESSLQPDARKALRLTGPICKMVLRADNKPAFQEQFDLELLPRLPTKTAQFLRTFVEAIQRWHADEPAPGPGAHYLENVVFNVYDSVVAVVVAEKGDVFVQKRLAAAKDALDSYLFE